MNNDTNTLLDTLLETAQNQWGVDESFINELMNKISFHESKGVVDAIQGNDGPGRGLFQYETGYRKGAHTAINRLIRETDSYPEFLSGISNNNYDIGGLTGDQQRALFLADKLRNPSTGTNLGVAMGDDDLSDEEIANYWVDYHWGGYGEDMDLRKNKIDKFLLDLQEGYRKGLINQ